MDAAELERDVHLQEAKLNLDELMDSVILAIRSLPQTVPLEMQHHFQRRLNIAIAMANPTLPPDAVDRAGTGEERVFARRSIIFA